MLIRLSSTWLTFDEILFIILQVSYRGVQTDEVSLPLHNKNITNADKPPPESGIRTRQ
jgi:hypothetical protein